MAITVSELAISPTPILQDSPVLSDAALRLLARDDGNRLARYFTDLSERTRSLFAPHPFTREEAYRIVGDPRDQTIRYVATTDTRIIGYFLLHPGLHDSDRQRYASYGIDVADCASFAPSVCDEFQGHGIGGASFRVIQRAAEAAGVRCLTLMGGVQARNSTARAYYLSLGYREAGYFQTAVENIDMMLPVDR